MAEPAAVLAHLPYETAEFWSNTESAGKRNGNDLFLDVYPTMIAVTGKAPDYQAWISKRRRQENELAVTGSIVIGDEIFPISSIPPENLKVIKLLDEWFSEPDNLGEEAWKEYDRILAEGLRF